MELAWYSNRKISEMQSTSAPVIGHDDSSSPWRFVHGSTRIVPGRWKYRDRGWVCVVATVITCITIGRNAIVDVTTSQLVLVYYPPIYSSTFTPLSAMVDELRWLISSPSWAHLRPNSLHSWSLSINWVFPLFRLFVTNTVHPQPTLLDHQSASSPDFPKTSHPRRREALRYSQPFSG
jgi:hypothetical protein